MSETSSQTAQPPQPRANSDGRLDTNAAADIIEWFLNFDERVARMRHPQVNELFLWKRSDDEANGAAAYPFENAEARFAIGVIQALEQNDKEPLLAMWISDVLSALQEAREKKQQLSDTYNLDKKPLESALEKAEKLTTSAERRIYLTSCWFDALFTAEARVLGWIYQELYGKPFQPAAQSSSLK
jgi:hypothetical protein